MSVELLQNLSVVCFVVAVVLLVVSIALFFVLDVRKLIGDITGSNARKAIETIRQQNEESGDKAYKPSPVNRARGRTTDKISPSGRLEKRSSGMAGSPGTEELVGQQTAPISNETTVLAQNMEPAGETTVLMQDMGFAEETTLLTPEMNYSNETTVLTPEMGYSTFSLDVEMSFIGSGEIIE